MIATTEETTRPTGSVYLQWAKTHPPARFNLTFSGVPAYPLRDLPVTLDELELDGAGAYGHAPLREAIGARYGVPAACVVQAEGTSMGFHLAMAALAGPGDEVLIEHPWYEPLPAVARYLGATVTRFERRPEDGYAVDPDAVARALTPRTRLVVLTNLHNPSGARVDDDTLRAVGEAAETVGARVLVDEVYLDALFEEVPRSAFHLGPAFVTTSSLTKVYGLSGLRCGWIFADETLAHRIWRLTELYANVGVHVGERLGVAAFRHLDAIAARSRALLDANRAALSAFLAARPDLGVRGPVPGTTAFPRLPVADVEAFCTRLRERHETAVVPGRFFGAPGHVRLGLGTEPALFAEGLDRLGRALDEAGRAGT
jgi:aspartate/methionine/tyrosine aminotransferase